MESSGAPCRSRAGISAGGGRKGRGRGDVAVSGYVVLARAPVFVLRLRFLDAILYGLGIGLAAFLKGLASPAAFRLVGYALIARPLETRLMPAAIVGASGGVADAGETLAAQIVGD